MVKSWSRRGSAIELSLALSVLFLISSCIGDSESRGRLNSPEGSLVPRQGMLNELWSVDLPAPGTGLAIHPKSGLLYVTVGQGGEGRFRQGGGLVTIRPDGAIQTEVPVYMRDCSDTFCPIFIPNSPILSSDGSALYFGDNAWNAFFYSTALNYLFDVRPHGEIRESDRIGGVSAGADLDFVSSRILIPGKVVYSLDMTDGEIRVARETESPVRQITRVSGRRYLLNLVDANPSIGRVAVWNPVSDRLKTFVFSQPIHWIKSTPRWNAALISQDGHCVVSELRLDDGVRGPRVSFKPAFSFKPNTPTGCSSYLMALSSHSRLIFLAGPGQAFAVHAEDGRVASLGTGRIKGVALSADESTAYVVEDSRVRAVDLRF